jgi:hypothetical protein
LYGGKKRVFAKFFNNVEEQIKAAAPGFNIVMAYGSAKFASGGPNEVSVPTGRWWRGETTPLRFRFAERNVQRVRFPVQVGRHPRVQVHQG